MYTNLLKKTFMDTMKLFMAILDRMNFLPLGKYSCFSEQTYRKLFEHETFDWFAFQRYHQQASHRAKEKPSPSILYLLSEPLRLGYFLTKTFLRSSLYASYSIFFSAVPPASLSCSISSNAGRVAMRACPVSRAAEGLEGASEPVCGCL